MLRNLIQPNDRIHRAFDKINPIVRDSDILCLQVIVILVRSSHDMSRVHQHQLAILHDCTSGETASTVVALSRRQCNRQVRPRNQITAHRMAPVHRPPYRLIGIMLIEQMIIPPKYMKPLGSFIQPTSRHQMIGHSIGWINLMSMLLDICVGPGECIPLLCLSRRTRQSKVCLLPCVYFLLLVCSWFICPSLLSLSISPD